MATLHIKDCKQKSKEWFFKQRRFFRNKKTYRVEVLAAMNEAKCLRNSSNAKRYKCFTEILDDLG